MPISVWIFQFILWANQMAAAGYTYDLSSGQLVAPDGSRVNPQPAGVVVTTSPAPTRDLRVQGPSGHYPIRRAGQE